MLSFNAYKWNVEVNRLSHNQRPPAVCTAPQAALWLRPFLHKHKAKSGSGLNGNRRHDSTLNKQEAAFSCKMVEWSWQQLWLTHRGVVNSRHLRYLLSAESQLLSTSYSVVGSTLLPTLLLKLLWFLEHVQLDRNQMGLIVTRYKVYIVFCKWTHEEHIPIWSNG